MPRPEWSDKRDRQYEHIKEGLLERGESVDTAEEIAARTVNKERARHGESETASRGGVRRRSSTTRRANGTPRSFEDDQGPARPRGRPLAKPHRAPPPGGRQ